MHEAVTEDALLGGKVFLRQPARGFRANVDSVLLAAAVEGELGMTLMEAGCGVGAALLCAARMLGETRFVGVEREAALADLARENTRLNGMEGRIAIECGDALARGGASFDGAFCNPPFDDEQGAQAPRADRAHAYLTEASIDEWVKALADRLKGGAALTMIHRAHRLSDILAALEGRLGGVEVLPIRPRAAAAASRILVRARKGSHAPLALLGGIDLHDASGTKYTALTEGILRGEARISWRAA